MTGNMQRLSLSGAVLALVALTASACGNDPGTRAVTGGALGAGAGAAIGAAAGNPVAGAVVGGAAGAVVGAATTPEVPRYYRYY